MPLTCTDYLRQLVDDYGIGHVVADIAGLCYCLAECAVDYAEESGDTENSELAECLERYVRQLERYARQLERYARQLENIASALQNLKEPTP